MLRILGFICALLLSSSPALLKAEQALSADSTVQQNSVKGIQFSSREEAAAAMQRKSTPWFSGFSLSADIAGAVMKTVSSWGQYEAALRVNLKEKYFPIVEAGWGASDHTSEATNLHFKTGAPYFRIGCDYNFIKNPQTPGRLLGGVRYAFTSFDFDLDGPNIINPIGGETSPFVYKGLSSKMHWLEFVVGVEAKIWSFVHLGWSLRYKIRLNEESSEIGSAWYVPGFGKNGGSCLGGTLNLTFDI